MGNSGGGHVPHVPPSLRRCPMESAPMTLLTGAVKFVFSVWTLSHTVTTLIQLYARAVHAFKLIKLTSCTKHINQDSIPLLKARNENAMVTQKPRTWKPEWCLDTQPTIWFRGTEFAAVFTIKAAT